MFFNPAALGRLDGFAAEVQGSHLSPHSKLKSSSATTAAGTPITGPDSANDIANDNWIGAGYLMLPVGDRVRLGLGVTSPFGLQTTYSDDWVGRYDAQESKLETVNLNPTVAVRVTNWLSVGAGFQAQHAYGKLTQAVDFGTIGAGLGLPVTPGGDDGGARLSGDSWGYGYDLGVLVEPVKGTRFGLAYRSEIDNQLEGDASFSDDPAGVAAAAQATTGAFSNTNGRSTSRPRPSSRSASTRISASGSPSWPRRSGRSGAASTNSRSSSTIRRSRTTSPRRTGTTAGSSPSAPLGVRSTS